MPPRKKAKKAVAARKTSSKAVKVKKEPIKLVPLASIPKAVLNADFERSALAGKSVPIAEANQHPPVKIVDIETGELRDNPAVLLLQDDTETYYSHSFIKQIAGCSAQAYFKKIHAPQRPGYALVRGSTIHNLLEKFIKNGEDPLEGFDDEWQKNVTSVAPFMSISDQEKVDFGYRETRLMIEDFVAENKDLVAEGRTESEVEFSVPVTIRTEQGSFSRRIYGKIDWIVHNSDGSYEIHDFKSSSNAPSDNELDRDTQFAIYQHACTVKYGKPPIRITWYQLKGINLTGVRFSKDHPRNLNDLMYCCDIKVKKPEELQILFDTYYGPAIIKWEIGLYEKNLSDTRKCMSMCSYREHCDTVKLLPLPRFARLAPK